MNIKKLFSALKALFTSKPSNTASESVKFLLSVSRKQAADFERMALVAGWADDMRSFFAAMSALTRWALRVLEEGKIIVALDPATLRYNQLSARSLFPNYADTSDQDVDTERRSRMSIVAQQHEWIREQQDNGLQIFARTASGELVPMPIFVSEDDPGDDVEDDGEGIGGNEE